MTWQQAVIGAALLITIAYTAARVAGGLAWGAQTRSLRTRLDTARATRAASRYDPAELEGLPRPVQRYFQAALTPGQRLVQALEITHRGEFNMGRDRDDWKPFSSRQRVIMRRPGFLWDARVTVAPGLPAHVHDAYVDGEGILQAALLGLVTIMRLRDTGEVARGELMRFFAETAWYPTALLPTQGVVWEAVDDRSANATLRDGALSLTLLFRFGEDGLIESVHAPDRGRLVGQECVPTPWEGRWYGYERREGMMVPTRGEVAWILPQGPRPYWRGRVVALRYESSL